MIDNVNNLVCGDKFIEYNWNCKRIKYRKYIKVIIQNYIQWTPDNQTKKNTITESISKQGEKPETQLNLRKIHGNPIDKREVIRGWVYNISSQ